MIMGGTASSASQLYLMSPGSAGVKPDGAASLCCAEVLAARKTESPNLRGLLSCWDLLGLGGTRIKGWGPHTAWKGLSAWAVLMAAFPSLGQTSPYHCQLTCKKWTSCKCWACHICRAAGASPAAFVPTKCDGATPNSAVSWRVPVTKSPAKL